jgi:hypothetical protein
LDTDHPGDGVLIARRSYAENKICYKFEGTGNGCMWIRKVNVKQVGNP